MFRRGCLTLPRCLLRRLDLDQAYSSRSPYHFSSKVVAHRASLLRSGEATTKLLLIRTTGISVWRHLSSYSFRGEKLRVAVVGGGCAGLSSALHLAPLVDEGLIAGPIDVFDDDSSNKNREIGVGIWSTALDSFRASERTSHQVVYNSMMAGGTWLSHVGYRTPDGAWLMKSKLPENEAALDVGDMPALLFLRERDMLESLQKAAHWEEHLGTILVHRRSGRVDGLFEESSQSWSTNLMLSNNKQMMANNLMLSNNKQMMANNETHADGDMIQKPTMSERDYHLIVAADGMNSTLRRTYGGHETEARRLIGTSALPSPIDLPNNMNNMDYMSTVRGWDKSQHEQAVGLQDRHYTVFRGNAHATRKELTQEDNISFQTWGTGRSMRFATVPMLCPIKNGREERQVWFITIDNDAVAQEADATKRRDMLLEEFKEWHDPIRQTILATPPEEILMERAIAHRHCTGPVLAFNTKVVRHLRGRRPPSSGEGPCIVFVGDSYMTVDPILAQGFTCAMEGGAALRNMVVRSCRNVDPPAQNELDPQLAFDPIQLRRELKERQSMKMDRLICLLRATELVQALGQPSGSTTLSGFLNTKILRPLMRWTPNFIKAPIFDAVLKYSLGLGLFRKAEP